jgi:hypothetical protein
MIFEVIHTFFIAFLVLGSVLGIESNTRQEATNLDLDTWMLRANQTFPPSFRLVPQKRRGRLDDQEPPGSLSPPNHGIDWLAYRFDLGLIERARR